MKAKTKTIDFFTDIGVAKASKAIKKQKAEKPDKAIKAEIVDAANKTKKDAVVATESKKVKKSKVLQQPAAHEHSENPEETTEQPKKRHKKKEAKKLAALNKGTGKGQKDGSKNNTKPIGNKSKASLPKQKKNVTVGSEGQSKRNIDKNEPGQKEEAQANQLHEESGKKQKPKTKVKVIPDDADVETSESETEDEANESQTAKKEKEEEQEKIIRSKEYTLFIGNIPPTKTAAHIRTMFKKYGTILSMRFRTNTGSKLLRRKDMKKAQALNCYVRFEKMEDVQKACEMDGHMVDGNRLRVSPQDVKQFGHVKSTVFVGNIRAGTKDTELYEFFSTVGNIEYVRQIGARYVAYVCFKKGVSIKKALKLDGQKLNDRPLRITRVDPTRTNLKKNKKGHLVKKNRLPAGAVKNESDGGDKKQANGFHGNVVNKSASKKKKATLQPAQKAKKILALKLKAAGARTA